MNKIEDKWMTYGQAKSYVQSLEIKNIREWRKYCKSGKRFSRLPSMPQRVYSKTNEWINWGDFFGTGIISLKNMSFMTYHEAKAYTNSLGIKSVTQWKMYWKTHQKPSNIPIDPCKYYSRTHEWDSWGEFLGTGVIAPQNRDYMSYSDAKKYVQLLGLKYRSQWRNYWQNNRRPENLPSNPETTYKLDGQWVSWVDFLGTNTTIPGYWNVKENVLNEALKYNTKKKFSAASSGAYVAALRNGWHEQACEHMETSGNRFVRMIYAYEFEDNHVYIGLTCNVERRHAEHLSSHINNNSAVRMHINITGLIPLLVHISGYIDVKEAIKLEKITEHNYTNNGWITLNRTEPGGTGGNILVWNKNACIEESKKYHTRTSFARGSGGAYAGALKNGWLDDICNHMKQIKKPNGYWCIENIKLEALKYYTRTQFLNGSSGAYDAAHKKGWLDEVCKHMKKF